MMTRIILLCLCLLLLGTTLNAQRSRNDQPLMHRKATNKTKVIFSPRVYIGFSTGINNPLGVLGPQADVVILPVVSVGTGIGLSSWGYKAFIEGRYYFKSCNSGWAVGGGFTYNTGLDKITLNVETVYGNTDVVMRLNPQPNFMASGYYFFNLGRSGRNRFHLQAGYSIPLKEVTFTSPSYPILTEDGRNSILAIAPGGLILGLGFSFGLGGL